MAMATRLIEPKEWERFFDEFSRAHEGDSVVMREIDSSVGDQVQAISPHFAGISADVRGSEPGAISVMLGSEVSNHIEHTISKPTRVYFYEGTDRALITSIQIEQQEGPRLILELHAAPVAVNDGGGVAE